MADLKFEVRSSKYEVPELGVCGLPSSLGLSAPRPLGRFTGSRRRGFTLVECLVAGTVLALFGASIVIAAGQSAAATGAGPSGGRRRSTWMKC